MNVEHNLALQKHLAPLFKREGFVKERATWWKSNPDSISVFNIQSSHWGPTLYINLGIYFRSLGAASKPKEFECLLRASLDTIASDPRKSLWLLEYSNAWGSPPDTNTRHRELEHMIVSEALPWLETCSTLTGAQVDAARTDRRRFYVDPALRRSFVNWAEV
jgi:hypothetical protein